MWSKFSSALKPREGNDSVQSTPDPFHVNATTYYTPTTADVHEHTTSREEDIIWSLRTQLALQQELCAQFEIDLRARDELVEALTNRFEASEKENDKHKNVVRSWKKKAVFLEKMCCRLEEEERNSLAQTLTGAEDEIATLREALSNSEETGRETVHQLHQQMSQLEREKSEVEMAHNDLARAMEKAQADILRLQEELSVTNDASRQAQKRLHDQVLQLEREKGDVETERDDFSSEISRLRAHIQQLQKDSAVMEVTIVQLNKQRDQDKEDIGGLNIALESKQQELELVKRKHGARGAAGPPSGRTSAAPSTAGNTVLGNRTSPPVSRAPSVLGRAANTKPSVTGALRRVSSSSLESKKPSSRMLSVTSSGANEKENAAFPYS